MYSSTTQAPILLVGSAHVVDLDAPLRAALSERVLDAIAVELDAERAHAVFEGSPGTGGPPAGVPIFVRLWGHLQKRLGEQMGAGFAGAEMRTAATLAKERSLPLFLIDDPIRETIQRLLRSLSFRERISLVLGGILGLVVPARLVERELDAYQEEPAPFVEEIRRHYPAVARVLLDERNEHMADRLREIRSRGYGRLAAVVGDAHVPGLTEALHRRGIPVESIALGRLMSGPGPTSA